MPGRDDARIRFWVRTMLRDEACEIVEAEDGEQAIEMVATHHPDFVVLDMQMPGMSGIEALPEIRKLMPAVPIMILTAYPDSDMVAQAMKRAPILLQKKPAGQEQIVNSTRVALGRVASHR